MFPESPANQFAEWGELVAHAAREVNIADLLKHEPDRLSHLTTGIGNCYLDLSRQSFDLPAWQALCNFAHKRDLPKALSSWFFGQPVNKSENRAATHQLYRHSLDAPKDSFSARAWKKANWPKTAMEEQLRMQKVATAIRTGTWKGTTDKPLTTIINIGIGGSYLGVEAVYLALAPYHVPKYKAVFIANIDPLASREVIKDLDLSTCAIVLSSKSGSTLESKANFAAVQQAFTDQGIVDTSRHIFGVTANPKALEQLPIDPQQIFTFPESVGGRYSLFSPIGFALACGIDPQALQDMRQGAADMDKHTIESDLAHNMPAMLALASIWHHGLKNTEQHAILAYSHALRGIVHHLQQLVMESNGKSVTINGESAPPSGEIIWGGENSNGQHSYFQLLHQGNRPQHVDLLLFARSLVGSQDMQDGLLSMALGQLQALTFGSQHADIQRATHGNIPLSLLACKQLDAYTLGMLIALYENRTIAQAALLGINPFDQWGVEYGKLCAENLAQMLTGENDFETLDSGLVTLLHKVNNWRKET